MPFVLNINDLGRVHFIGICGTAMASAAGALFDLGVDVVGSDAATYPPMSTFLENKGIRLFNGYSEENLRQKPKLVVVGNAISRGNPELEYTLDNNIPYCSLPELIESVFLPGKEAVVVTGTHGKTTTSSLITWILKCGGLDPSWLIGGVPAGLDAGSRISAGLPFVLEGDEYDTAFFDKRPKFLHYRPKVVILNNLEFDHADIYPNLDRIREVFGHLVRIIPKSGLIIANADEPEIMELVKKAPCKVVTYSVRDQNADWFAKSRAQNLEVAGPEGQALLVEHNLTGSHQAWNILSAIVCARHFGLPADEIAAAIKCFGGVKRRAEKVGTANTVDVFDDFAHHPTAILGTIEGFAQKYPGRRIITILEPRSNTMRRAVFQERLAQSFAGSAAVFLRQVPDPEKSPENDRLDVAKLAQSLNEGGIFTKVLENADAIVAEVKAFARANDIVLVLSNGGFEGIHKKLMGALAELKF